MKDANRPTSRGQTGQSASTRKPDPAAMEKYMRGSSDPQGQADYESATAQETPSPEEAGFQEQPGQCDGCTNMQQDGSCSYLNIPVKPTNFCRTGYQAAEQQQPDEQATQAAPAAPATSAGGQGGPVGF